MFHLTKTLITKCSLYLYAFIVHVIAEDNPIKITLKNTNLVFEFLNGTLLIFRSLQNSRLILIELMHLG